ncbi:MAG: hypothetical protein DRQ55_14140 [Planctomycetota bacterium]|nr:MAG: hypothetical protein DRQ55_14140 [Planctomycetota bacterium]
MTGVNIAIVYGTSVVAARTLGLDRFGDYAVALASVALLSTLAELGTGKYAMRAVPAYVEAAAFGLARGYRRFATRTVLASSVALALLAWGLEWRAPGDARALQMALLFLPVMALVGYGAEAVQANHATLRSAVITRLVVPGVSLAALLAWLAQRDELDPVTAVAFHGLGWLVGLLLTWRFLASSTPDAVREATPELRSREWLLRSLPFLGFALLLTALTRSSLIVLEYAASAHEASVFAAALETGTILALVGKATDKMFLPSISLLIERRDVTRMLHERRRRLRWVGSLCLAHLIVMALAGRWLLSLFGPGFEDGYVPLLIVSGGTAVWTFFSLSPSYLKYVMKQRFVLLATGVAALSSAALTWALGARWGSLGAAIAFTGPVAALYLVFAAVAWRDKGRFLEHETH